MKIRYLIIALFVLVNISNVYASDKYTVKLSKCIDGDTARFILNGKEVKARFIGINTPEYSDDNKEPYGKESSEYTCELLTNAKKIQVQYDPKSDEKDKYDRELLWVFVDNELLQKKIIEKGYGKVHYVYADYLYVDELKIEEEKAKEKQLGVWSTDQNTTNEKIEDDDLLIKIIKKLIGLFGDIFEKVIYFLENLINSVL